MSACSAEPITDSCRALLPSGRPRSGPDGTRDADDLYEQLERVILPLFYERPDDHVDVMRQAIALTGSFSTRIACCSTT